MAWHNTPYLFPIFFSCALTAAIGIVAWRRRRQASTARSMAVFMLGASIWTLSNTGILLCVTVDAWQVWRNINYLGIVLIPAAWLVYVVQMTGKEHLLSHKRVLLLAIEPVLVQFAVWTNGFHHLFFTGYAVESTGLFVLVRAEYGPLFLIHAVYSNVIMLLGFMLLLNGLLRQRSMYRGQYITVMIGALVPWLGNLLFLTGLLPFGNLDLTPILFGISSIMFFWALFRYQLFELSPIARDRLIEVMGDAVLVLDLNERVVDLNPTFEYLVRLPARKIIGRPIKEVLGGWSEAIQCPDDGGSSIAAVIQVPDIDSHLAGCCFDLKMNRLFNRSGHCIGWLAVVRDVTKQKRVEEENLRLYQVEHEGRLMAEVLHQAGQILSATLELDTLLDRLLEQVGRIVPYDTANVIMIEDEKAIITRSRGFEKFGIDPLRDLRSIEFELKKTENLNWMMEHKLPLSIADTHTDPGWVSVPITRYIHSWIGAPLIARDHVIGFFSMDKVELGFYQAVHMERLAAFANHAALAIENARLFQAVQRRADEAEALRAATAAVTSALDLDQVLEHILVHLKRVVPYDSAAIFLQEGDMVRVRAGSGFAHPDRVVNCRFSADDALFQEAKESAHGIIIADAQSDPRYKRMGDADHVRGWMGVPLQTRGQTIGFLAVDSCRVAAFNATDAALAQTLANEAATAIENARLFAEVQRLAITDPLTGLFNRRHFFTLARREFERSLRYGSPLSLIMLDADDLKVVNDHYGHLAGDQLLEMVAERCQEVLRAVDILGRYAGDEFVILLPETNRKGAIAAADRLCKNVADRVLPASDGNFRTSISIGIAELDPNCQSVEMLIERADQALYFSKRTGKNHATFWEADLLSQLQGQISK